MQAEQLHRLLCAPLLRKRINHDGHCHVHGEKLFTYLKIPFYYRVRLLREEIAQEPLDQFCGKVKALPFKFRPKWLLFLFCLSVLKLLAEKWQLPHPHPRPHLQSGFWQEKKRGVLVWTRLLCVSNPVQPIKQVVSVSQLSQSLLSTLTMENSATLCFLL